MAHRSPRVPQEILEEVVDCLPHGSLDSLKAIALASRHLLESARRRLFHKVYLTEPLWLPIGTWKISRFNPSLFKYARQVIIRRCGPCFQVSEVILRDVLRHVRGVRSLDIGDSCILREWVKCGLFDFCSALVKLSVDLDQDIPLDFLYSLPLQHLRITYTSSIWPTQNIGEPSFTCPSWQLKSLHYSHAHNGGMGRPKMPLLASPLTEAQVYGGLVHLSLDISQVSDHNFALSRILPACTNSPLETLKLRYINDFYGSRGFSRIVPNGLPTLPSLRYLSIGLPSFWVEDHPAMPRRQANFFTALIGQSTQPALEAIGALFSWNMRCLTSAQFGPQNLIVRDLGWDKMDAVLASQVLYPRLRAVRVMVHLEGRPTGAYEKYLSGDGSELGEVLRKQTAAALSNARESGLIVDSGSKATGHAFDQIANSMINPPWSSLA